jgi:hypothetical protein
MLKNVNDNYFSVFIEYITKHINSMYVFHKKWYLLNTIVVRKLSHDTQTHIGKQKHPGVLVAQQCGQ